MAMAAELLELAAPALPRLHPFSVLQQPDVWICDSGASCHTTNNLNGAVNKRRGGSSSVGHTGGAVTAEWTVDIPGRFVSADGCNLQEATLTDVSFNKSLNYNLFSLSRVLKLGWVISKGDSTGITIKRDSTVIVFDIVVHTANGAVFATRFLRDSELFAACTEKGLRVNINKAHELLGHGDEESTRASARVLGWTITRGTLKPCAHCAKAKARHKDTKKKSDSANKATEPGERMFLDLSKVTVSRDDQSKYTLRAKWWRGMVDEVTGKMWSDFSETKNGMVEPACELLNQLKARGLPIKVIRMDPAGENIKLEQRLKSADWAILQPIKVEYTAAGVPQHNGPIEIKFPTVASRGRALMNAAWVPDDSRGKVAVEALRCATQLDGLRVVEVKGVKLTRDMHVYGSNPTWIVSMRTWGEAGVVYRGKDGKAGNRGVPMMFVGYSERESDTYRMWNPETNSVCNTRDVIWLKRMFYQQPQGHFVIEEEPIEPDHNPIDDADAGVEEQADDTAVEPPEGEVEDETGEDDVERHVTWANAVDATSESAELEAGGESTPTVHASILRTRSGRSVKTPSRLIETMESLVEGDAAIADMHYLMSLCELDNEELNMYSETAALELRLPSIEVSQVGAGYGGGFTHTDELKVMNCRQAMNSADADK